MLPHPYFSYEILHPLLFFSDPGRFLKYQSAALHKVEANNSTGTNDNGSFSSLPIKGSCYDMELGTGTFTKKVFYYS